MTDQFIDSCGRESSLFQAVYSVLIFGKSEDEKEVYNRHRTILNQLEQYIEFYQNRADLNVSKIPIFLMLESEAVSKNIITEYITIREGVFNNSTIESIKKELARDAQRGGIEVPTKDGSEKSKAFFRNITCWIKGCTKTGKMHYGDALKRLKKHILIAANNIESMKAYSSSMLICRAPEVPDGRNSLLGEFFDTSYDESHPLFCNTSMSGDAFFDYLGEQEIQFDIDNPIHSNIFMLYSNTEQSDFSVGSLDLLSQIGYHVENLFVFVFSNSACCLKNLKREITRHKNKYTPDDIFFLNQEERAFIDGHKIPELSQCLVGSYEDYDLYGTEVKYILEGLPYTFTKRNIMALCATRAAEEYFFNYVSEETPDYELPESAEIFNYIRNTWENEIIPTIRNFCSDKKVAFIIDWRTPDEIKNELKNRLSEYSISFYGIQDLKLSKGKNKIKEDTIIRIRYDMFRLDDNITYPNSYEPVVLNGGQRILDIVPLALMAAKKQKSENNIISFYNKVMDQPYRKERLGWKKETLKSMSQFNSDWDERDDARIAGREQARVEVVYSNGRKNTFAESTLLVYRDGVDNILWARAGDLVDEEVKAIQSFDDMEETLKILVTSGERRDSDAEKSFRIAYMQSDGIEDNPEIEIWRLLLKKRVEEKGKEQIYNDITSAISKLEKNPKSIIDNWLDFEGKSKTWILPRRNSTRNAFFDYIGIPRTSPYRALIYRKRMRTIKSTMEQNRLLDQFICAVIGKDLPQGSFKSLYAQIPESMDLLDITDDDCLLFVQSEINKKLKLSDITSITNYGE